MSFNPDKCEHVRITLKKEDCPVNIQDPWSSKQNYEKLKSKLTKFKSVIQNEIRKSIIILGIPRVSNIYQ